MGVATGLFNTLAFTDQAHKKTQVTIIYKISNFLPEDIHHKTNKNSAIHNI